jgi:hypothetical protein
MRVRALESMTIGTKNSAWGANNYEPIIPGYTMGSFKDLLAVGIARNVREGRLLYDWDTYEADNSWKSVPAQPDHEVDINKIYYNQYTHGGRLELQAVYWFDIEG